ncbi:thiamine pyrophosphate-requiring protein [Alkalilimnicola ehrlichii]|uniref:Thiamine pyrophosphate-requiring protein n=1 Tax=Alkalilimnicola ehrlichii TaxID=351052 RepID=A0A3E0X0E9_9GAMM|nr:thiamine pyrophosphate-requiring protein [Alkalilimnicola ehrlichii]RFA29020.1 thiamine pyrophosphate-requiring protein [Alkalilimnicola ehrlichii]RFA38655.1 thiamine pyrophosphate-requiring protein [Alkalilimnicola ehrlichii]
MAETVGDFIIQRLHDWGVRRIYGYPGDGINGLMGALNRASDKMHYVQVRHEEDAAFMACGHAKYSGEVGVCLATSGPGAIHLLNGLYDAYKDNQPVVAIVGQQALMSIGSGYQQEVDLGALFKDVAHEYVQMASTPGQVRHLIDEAMRIAKAKRCVTCVIVPNNLQELPMETPPRKHGSNFSGIGYSHPRVVPTPEELLRAADVLNDGKRVAILVGAGIRDAAEEVIEAANLLGAGVAKAILAKTMIPDDLPFVTGSIGLLGTKASADMMESCDTLFMIGTSFPYTEFLPEEGSARGVQIDIEPAHLGLRYPNEVNLHGDAKLTLKALMPMLKKKKDRSWRNRIEASVADWWKVVESRAMNEANPINPQRVFWELSKRLPENVMLSADSGSGTNWYARDLMIRDGAIGSLSGGLATMCSGVPYIIAAKFCYPDRPAIAMVGDGAMQMLGINGLITISKYWREWENPKLVVLVLNNHDLNQVTWEQRVMEGDPKFEASQNIPDFDYDKYAQSLGLIGLSMNTPEDIVPVWEEALMAERPVVINAHTDPDVPPLPPHISLEQARKYTASLFKGEPNAAGVIRQSMKDVAASYIRRR